MLCVLLAGSLLNIAYLLPIPMRAFFSRESEDPASSGSRKAPPACVAALVLTAVACVLLFFAPEPVYRLMQLLVTQQG
jgi:multicomponent Na+:H+ antiporter subunit D